MSRETTTFADTSAPEVGTEDSLEMSEEWVRSFAQMELRRRERRQRPRERSGVDRRIELPEQENEASLSVMAERARERQMQEQRYGAHTSEIRSLEADLNERFDSIAHRELPVLWPSVPLRA